MGASAQEYLSTDEAAIYVKRTKGSFYKLMFYHRIPYTRPFNGKAYFLRSDLDAYLAMGRRATAAELADRADELLAKRA